MFEPKTIRPVVSVMCPSCTHEDVADMLAMEEGFRKCCPKCDTGMLTAHEMYAHIESLSAQLDDAMDAVDESFWH